MTLLTFTILSSILCFGCTVGLGLSYDDEQLELSNQEQHQELTESLTSGQYAFLLVSFIAAVGAAGGGAWLLLTEITKNV